MITLEGLSKYYNDFPAVRDVDLVVHEGELFGFLGPNGAGKTTTMHMIAGMIRPTAGRVRIGGIDVQQDPVRAKSLLGYIPDRPYIYDKLTGREFLRFIGGLYKVERAAIETRATELLERFHLSAWGGELTENYSHGMKQRLVMAASLLHEPRAIIVDEPMVGLDPQGARLVKSIFRDLTRGGRTVFMSTHSMDVAEELCDRIGIIAGGRLVALGTMAELRGRARGGGGDLAERLEEVFLALTEEEQVDVGAR
jgi:ABC-2 type transport system ATP-binding protein